MATGDVSSCLEASSGYGNMLKFDSGKYWVTFDSTGGVDERIWGKDPTAVYGKSALYVDLIQLGCCATAGPIALIDGSGGLPICNLVGSDVSTSDCGPSEVWDFGDDALVCLTADNTQSLCVSSTINGHLAGAFRCWWGPAPK